MFSIRERGRFPGCAVPPIEARRVSRGDTARVLLTGSRHSVPPGVVCLRGGLPGDAGVAGGGAARIGGSTAAGGGVGAEGRGVSGERRRDDVVVRRVSLGGDGAARRDGTLRGGGRRRLGPGPARGGNGTFGTDAGTRWALNEAGVYAVVDTYRPGAIAPGVLSGRRSRGRSSSSGSSNERVRGSCVQLFGTLVCVVVQAVRFC